MASPVTESSEVDLPATLMVQCPKVAFRLQSIHVCRGCDQCGGVADRFPGEEHIAPAKRFAIRCYAEPVKRPLLEMAHADH